MSKYVIGVLIPIIVLLTGCQSHTIQQNKEEARGSYSTEINNGEMARVLKNGEDTTEQMLDYRRIVKTNILTFINCKEYDVKSRFCVNNFAFNL